MKRRAYWVILLLLSVTLGLFWWMWQNPATADQIATTDSAQGSAKTVVASTSVQKPTLTLITVPEPSADANAASVINTTQTPREGTESAPAAPAQAGPPMQHSAIITVPLARAEHHLFPGNQDMSILGVFDRPDSSDAVVDLYVWDDSNGRGSYIRSVNLSGVNSESLAYIRSWEQQQQAAAAANSTPPQLIAATPPVPPYADSVTALFNSEILMYINSVAQQQQAAASNSTTLQLTAATPWMVREAIEAGGNILDELNQRVESGASAAQIQTWLSAVARVAATSAPQPQSVPEPTDQ